MTTKNSSPIKLVPASEARTMLELSGIAGWNQSLADCGILALSKNARAIYAMCGERPVGSAAAYIYGKSGMAFINMVVVIEEFRGRGIATMMLKRLIEITGDCPVRRLYATEAGSHVYSKLGFVAKGRMHKYFSDVPCASCVRRPEVAKLLPADLGEAVKLDEKSFGFNRAGLMEHYFNENQAFAFAFPRNGRMGGFTLSRSGSKARHIFINADSEECARALLENSSATPTDSKSLQIVVLEDHADFAGFALAKGFRKGTSMIIMDHGGTAPLPSFASFSPLGGEFG